MERSLFPDGVVVKQKDLVYSDQSKIQQILRRHTNAGVMGVVSGGSIKVSSDTFGVKIVPFVAYAPNGELINYQSILDNVPLADATANAINYVLAVYTESESNPSPHESLGIQVNTRVVAGCRIRVMTEASYVALPATSANLANDALDRAVVLAVVTAQGAGVALQQSNITSSTTWADVLSVGGTAITGVGIVSVSPDTQVGIGTLTYTPAAGGALDKLTWRAPNDLAGAAVDIPGDGTYTLYSASGQTLIVTVVLSSLPGGTSQVSDTLDVTSLYSQEVPRFTARDDQHRHMVGSGTPTAKNPHGLTVGDLSGGGTDPLIQEHQDVFHANGIVKNDIWGPVRATLKPSIQHGSNPTVDSVGIGGIGAGEIVVVNGMTLTELNGSPTVSFQDIQTGYVELWGVYIDSTGALVKSKRARMNFDGGGWGQPDQDPLGGAVQVVNVSDEWIAQVDIGVKLIDGPARLYLNDSITGLNGPVVEVPATSGIVRLKWHDNVRWVDVYVYVPSIPGLSKPATSNMRIYPKMDNDTHLMLTYVTSHGTASPILGYGQWNVVSALTDNLIDARRFGTTDLLNIRDDSTDAMVPQFVRDALGNGYINGFDMGPTPGNDVSIKGGLIYYDGARCRVDSAIFDNLTDTTHYIYASVDGYGHATMYETTTLATAQAGLLLYTVTVTAGVVSNITLNARKVILATAEDLAAHVNDTSAAHAASAISFSPVDNLVSTDVQNAIKEANTNAASLMTIGTPVTTPVSASGAIWTELTHVAADMGALRPVLVKLMPHYGGAGQDAYFRPIGGGVDSYINITVDGTIIASFRFTPVTEQKFIPDISTIYIPLAAGNKTYAVNMQSNNSYLTANYWKLALVRL